MTPIPHTHLRAGNIVTGIPIALGFLKDEPFEIFPLSAQDIWILEMGRHKVYGVPLTAKMVKQNWFYECTPKTFTGGRIYIKPKVGRIIIFKDGCAFSPYNSPTRIPFKYFHELQNIMFYLTGEELTYTVT